MTPHPALVGFVRALGAFQAGVGVYALLAPGSNALWLPVLAGAGVFWVGRGLRHLPAVADVVARGYLAPLALLAGVGLVLAAPPTWDAAAAFLRQFAARVYGGTPASAYLACLGYACLSARPAPGTGFYR